MIQTAIAKVAARQTLTTEEAKAAMASIMSGEATPAQIGALIAGLRVRGETTSEVVGFVSEMRGRGIRINSRVPEVADTCGTGGDGSHTLNISTGAALAAAGTGLVVAKHGNRAMSSRAGSADALEALGVKIDAEPETVESCLNDTGIAFCFAQKFHPAMRFAGPPRREIGIRTIFNLLGPLANPAGARYQLIGVADESLLDLVAESLAQLGTGRSLVVHSRDGLDELSIAGANAVLEIAGSEVKRREEWDCRMAGLKQGSLKDLAGGSPEENAEAIRGMLKGDKSPFRDAVVFNAAAICWVAGRAKTLREGADLAARAIDSGAAARKLEEMRVASNVPAALKMQNGVRK